jgi:glucose/arabinose dehydrogenase/PKD repeat protein
MRSVERGSIRRAAVALIAATTLAASFTPAVRPSIVEAAGPDAAQCQSGFLKKARPTRVDCPAPPEPTAVEAAVPPGFQETVVWPGLTNPTAIRFAADGRVFVAEKSGVIKVFDSLTDQTPTTFSGLTTNVHNFWDRGLLGMALDPSLTGGSGLGSYVYVLYAYDHVLGSQNPAPRWGDTCPNPPGATADGCLISARLSRLTVSGNTIAAGSELPLIEDWCQQYPSHSIGSLAFGPDGALYVSSGDGASFNTVDYGQLGGTLGSPPPVPKNPCGDPPNDGMSPPTAEGGALRSQDIRTSPVGSGYRTTVLADTPLAYWRLGESAGTTLVDQTGNHGGAYIGSPTLGTPGAIVGDADTSVTLDGSAEYGQATGWNTVPAPPITLEAWIKWNGTTWPTNTSVLGWFHQSGVMASRFWVSGNGTDNINLRIGFETGNANWNWAGENTNWHHLVGTHDGTNARLYFDGALVAGPVAVPFSGGASDHPLWIGTGSDTGTNNASWPGSIDEAAVYGRALSVAEIQEHFQAGISGGQGSGDPTTLDGTVLRVDPNTGAGLPGNPFFSSTDPNARRIIASGLRNPFRMTFRPGTNELWVGDVGWNVWEEINRIPNATDNVAENFGWPCYEGSPRQSGYDGTNLDICESLYAEGAGAVAAPYYAYRHSDKVLSTDNCPTGSSSISGLAFYPEAGGSYPASFRGGVFFSDYSRNCIWFIPKGTNGQPDPAQRQVFVDGAAGPVELVIGPGGDLFYVDFGGSIRRISATGGNQPPTAVIQATPTSGPAPLTVQFSGSGSSDPEGTPLIYEWDLDGDGAYDDALGVTASRTYTSPGNVTTALRVTDAGLATGTDTQVIMVANSPPVPVISMPAEGTTWKVGDLIEFSGSATDPQDGNVPASSLDWTLTVEHCLPNCHTHIVQTWNGDDPNLRFNAPDHEYPSHLELTLTATDSHSSQASVTRELHPQTVNLNFQSAPSGLSLSVNSASSVTPFTRTVIVGSSNSVTATSPQTLGVQTYAFVSWSDGGTQSHQIVAPATNSTYTATYQAVGIGFIPSADAYVRSQQGNKNFGTASLLRVRVNQYRSYLKFVVTGLSGAPSSAKLRLWVTDGGTSGGSVYSIANTTWTETGITWNNAPAITGSPLSSVTTATAGTWVEFDLGSAITGNGTYTFAISNGNNDAVDYASRETANDPVLLITP